jgi:hypothetical protein
VCALATRLWSAFFISGQGHSLRASAAVVTYGEPAAESEVWPPSDSDGAGFSRSHLGATVIGLGEVAVVDRNAGDVQRRTPGVGQRCRLRWGADASPKGPANAGEA